MPKQKQTTAEAMEELKRAMSEALRPMALLMIRVLTPPAEWLDRHLPPSSRTFPLAHVSDDDRGGDRGAGCSRCR